MAEALCRVCAISAGRVLRRTDAGIVAVPAQTVRPGHIMVVSATHAQSFSDLKPAEADAFMALVAAATRAAEESSGAERYYVVRIGDKAPHLHFHLVPRVEGEDSLAPYVFGDTGWSATVRADATPPSALFEEAFGRSFGLEAITHRAKQDAGRLPAWLVKLAISLAAFGVVFAIAWPLGAGPLTPALAVGVSSGVNLALVDRMSGRRVRWARGILTGLATGAWFFLLMRWLQD